MDPSIMKFFEEDEDETMHSGADVEAFTAELNRDIEGSHTSTSQQPSDAESAALSQGSSQPASQFLSPWKNTDHDVINNLHNGQDIMSTEQKEQHLPRGQLQQLRSESQNQKAVDDSSHELSLPLPNSSSMDVCPKTEYGENTYLVSQPAVMQTSGKQPLHVQKTGREPDAGGELELHKLPNMGNQQPVAMGSSTQHSMTRQLNDRHPLTIGKGSQQTNLGTSNEQATVGNQHTVGTGMTSQPAMTSGAGTQQSMTSGNQQQGVKLNKQVPFGMLLPIIQPQLDKDRAMQLHTLYFRLKKNEITKEDFVRHMRSIVGDQMLKMAVYKLQTQAARNSQPASNQFQSQPQASTRQMQVSSSDFVNPTGESTAMKLREMEGQADSPVVQGSQERKHPAYPTQGLNKQQPQQTHVSQTSFPSYGSGGPNYSPFSGGNVSSSTSLRPQTLDSQMRQPAAHQNMTVNHFGPTTQPMNMTNLSKIDRPHSFGDPKKIQSGTVAPMNSNAALQQNPVQWPSSTSKEQKVGLSSPMTYVKQEPFDQSNEQKSQLASQHGLSSLPSAQTKQGITAPGNSKDESFEMHLSRTGVVPPTSMVGTSSLSSSTLSPVESHLLSNSRPSSLTSPTGPGNNVKATPKKPLAGQKKPMEAPGSSPPPSSKKQKVSGAFLDQSIEQLNDVTAVSGVNLREEEEQLFSGPKEESRVSEASRRVVQEEEERLILHKIPLQKKVVEIMAKSGLKNMSNDVERCLSLCVEERMRGLITNLIRLSKQRVDIEKPRHRTLITSNIRQEVMSMNRKAREEWDRKQAEIEKSQKSNEPDSNTGAQGDKEKDESRTKSSKANKEEDDKTRATAANVAVRAATGFGDMLSRWQLMIEAKQKQGGTDTSSSSQPAKDVGRKPLPSLTRNTRENHEAEKRDRSASIRKVGRNQVVVPRVARNITVKDVIAVLEREPQMSKSSLLYCLYDKAKTDAAGG